MTKAAIAYINFQTCLRRTDALKHSVQAGIVAGVAGVVAGGGAAPVIGLLGYTATLGGYAAYCAHESWPAGEPVLPTHTPGTRDKQFYHGQRV